ncbi:hypothetical protein [Paenarthrobacter sp. C1]|uniref:hypothetical protein n=1 Tax=Paenarthrobacter sp. C1 TaxID=3400220 RepID=UPI003BF5E789
MPFRDPRCSRLDAPGWRQVSTGADIGGSATTHYRFSDTIADTKLSTSAQPKHFSDVISAFALSTSDVLGDAAAI